jgi:hypothetical protein
VTTLPYGHRTVVIGGRGYYTYDNIYYSRCPTGYVVVPQPVYVNPAPVQTIVPVQGQDGEAIVVNVPNSTGGFTPVRLTRSRDGYVGPQGEYYAGNPTVQQLKVLYGN